MALVKLKNVRVNFANVFEPTVSPKFPKNDPKYSIMLMLEKGTKQGRAHIAALTTARDAVLNGKTVADDKALLIDGDQPGQHEANAGLFTVKASNKQRPVVVDQQMAPLVAGDGVIYDGCYCNVTLDVYYFADMKGVFATLLGVQFAGDGEPLGRPRYTAEQMFSEG